MKKRLVFIAFFAFVMCFGMMSVKVSASESTDIQFDLDSRKVYVSNPTQFKDISSYSNGAGEVRDYPRNFSGWTIEITSDLDMSNITWQPLVDFKGSMTGATTNEKGMATIENLNVTGSSKVGLCANSASGKFSNLTIKNSSFVTSSFTKDNTHVGAFSGNGYTSSFENCHVVDTIVTGSRFVGGITGSCYGNITGCTVTGSKTVITAKTTTLFIGVYFGDNVGGIVGLVGEGNAKISECNVDGITVTGNRQAGGIAGAVQYGNTIMNCTVSNSQISAKATTYRDDATPCAGGIVGQLAAGNARTIKIIDNTVENITVTQAYRGQTYIGWAVGDANTRLNNTEEVTQYIISGNEYIGTTTLNEVGYSPANPSNSAGN